MKKEEIKEVINLLKDNSSDNIALLEKLYTFLNSCLGFDVIKIF